MTTIMVPFTVLDGDNGAKFIGHDHLHGMCYGKSAVKKLREIAIASVESALEDKANYRNRMIATKAGEVFFVRFSHGAWGYDIYGPDRHGASSCIMGGDFDAVLASARKHAESAFGGIAWEC